MSISFIVFIVVHLLALAYFLEIMRRVRQRAKEYPLHDTSETLPFGFVRLRHIIVLYALLYLLWVAFSVGFYIKWLDIGAGPALPQPTATDLNI